MAEDNRERMTKALDTMLLELQVPRQIVSPILRKLLQTYENEWDHIEADGYRVLADAIFQHQEQMDKKMCPGPSSVMLPKGKGKKKCVNQGGSRRQCSQRASKEIVRDSSSDSESSGEDHDDREYAPNSLEADRSYADRGNGAFRRSPPRGIAMRGALQNRCGEGGRREVLCHPVRKLKQPLEKATEPAGGRMQGAVCGRELLCQSSQKLKHAFEEEAVPVPGRSRVEGPPGSSVGNVILPVPGQKSPSPNVPTTLCKPLTALRPPLSCLPCGGNCVFDKVKFEVLDEESPREVFRELPKEAPAHYHQAGISCPVLQQASHGVQIKALMAGQPTVQNDNLIASTPKKVATTPFKGVTALMQVAVTPQDKGDSSHKRIFAPSQEVAKEENSNKLNSDSKRKLLNPSETVVVLKKPKLESVVMNELVARPNRKTLCNVFQISRVLPEALQAGKRPADWPSMSVPLYVCLRPPSPTMHMKTGAQAQPLQASFARNLQHFAVPKTEPSLEEVSGPPLERLVKAEPLEPMKDVAQTIGSEDHSEVPQVTKTDNLQIGNIHRQRTGSREEIILTAFETIEEGCSTKCANLGGSFNDKEEKPLNGITPSRSIPALESSFECSDKADVAKEQPSNPAISTEVQTHKDNLFQGLKKVKEEQPSDPANDVFKSPANGLMVDMEEAGHECRSSLAAIAMDYMDLGDSSSSLSEPVSIASGGCPELQNIVDSTVKEDVCVNSNMGLMDSASIGRDGESKGGVGQDKGMLELVVNIGPKGAEQGNDSPYEHKAALQEPGSQVIQEVPDGVKQMRHMSSEKNSKPPRGQCTRALKERASSPSTSSGSSQRANRVRQSNRKPQSESERLVGPQEAEMSDETDLSRGSEQIPISVEEFARSRLPRDFLYVSQSIVYQNAYIRFSLARIADEDCCKDCSGNCLASRYPCACARQSGGEYAYSLQGTLRKRFMEQEKQRRRAPVSSLSFCQAGQCPNERLKGETNLEPCKGHTQRHFIKECWEKCGCDKSCSNRVVQRGINCKLQVFWTVEGKGWGLRTLQDLPAGAFVCEYAGEILTNLEMDERNCSSTANTKHHFPLQLDADWSSERFLKDEEALCLDGTYFGNVARFINHRCFDNNMLDVPVEIESPDHHYYHVAFFTSQEVKANEELTWDYGLDFNDKEHPIEAFKCQCGSPYCRGKE
ncbi:hypothetical protein BDL97_09G085200 [Sphagnum fallax]|nr:hypothetical protein BDL97_09G085200 [Sphagnum fallax]